MHVHSLHTLTESFSAVRLYHPHSTTHIIRPSAHSSTHTTLTQTHTADPSGIAFAPPVQSAVPPILHTPETV